MLLRLLKRKEATNTARQLACEVRFWHGPSHAIGGTIQLNTEAKGVAHVSPINTVDVREQGLEVRTFDDPDAVPIQPVNTEASQLDGIATTTSLQIRAGAPK